jgi:hypothetical protein
MADVIKVLISFHLSGKGNPYGLKGNCRLHTCHEGLIDLFDMQCLPLSFFSTKKTYLIIIAPMR